jgi:outer membrane cobalamin receptor
LKKFLTASCFVASFCSAYAQHKSENDTTLFNKDLNEVVVTATRNERKLSNVAVPVTIISQKNIQQIFYRNSPAFLLQADLVPAFKCRE